MSQSVDPSADPANAPSVLRILRKKRGFVQIDNATVRDEGLSFRARGVLAYLLSHADGFHCTSRTMAAQGHEGRSAILTAMRELTDAGYVSHEKKRRSDGRMITVTTVREHPSLTAPGSDERTSVPGSDEPDPGQSDLLRTPAQVDQLPSSSPDQTAVEKREDDDGVSVIREAVELITNRRMVGKTPDNPLAYRNTVRGEVRRAYVAEAKQAMDETPGLSAESLAALLEPPPPPPPPPAHASPEQGYRHVPDADETARRWAEDEADRADEGVPDLEEVRRIAAEAKRNLKRRTAEGHPVSAGRADTGPPG